MEKRIYHRLQRGETLEALSARYGVPVCVIARANPGERFAWGQVLAVPRQCAQGANRPVAPAMPRFRCSEYAVQPDDTLYSISRRTGVTMRILQKVNALSGMAELQPGSRLQIPAIRGKRYYVREGESLADIAASHGVTEAALREKNLVEDGEAIGPGACLLI